jgi:soluble lytic murein transglycosylase-like protein
MKGYNSKLGAMPKLASQLKSFPVENSYASVVKYYNRRLSDAEALVIARAVLTFSEQTKGAVDPRLVMALIKAESNFRPEAVSRVGALGLGQLMPATARGLGIRNPMDPIQNIYGCVKYLERESYRWRNSENAVDLVLASYNAGSGAVSRYKGVPPYRETRNYVKIVKQNYRTYTRR